MEKDFCPILLRAQLLQCKNVVYLLQRSHLTFCSGWLNDSKVLTVTLGGKFKVFSVAEHLCETVVVDGNAEGAKPASDASKVNAMTPMGDSQIAVGGLTGSGKGFVNIYFIKHQGPGVLMF